ncbi:hypothetical protein C1H46_006710 [Malus baccata]|uniref:CSC1/OSCA1-like 7TM region domain-containing protein n=2 Tax=Malus baccata TaxID=106549 RepID=A0A540N9Q6_MALBA|nr:hypothetical protein C1H46_006710 [Malus baccata]
MATLNDIAVAAAINILTAFAFFLAFAILRIQPVNDRVYFPKWYLKGLRCSPFGGVSKFVNLDFRLYAKFLNWMPAALQMPEPELVDHAGLDSAVYLRIYLTGLKIFVPIAFLAYAVMVPVNWTNSTLKNSTVVYSNIDELSISNVPLGSHRFWTHLVMAYAFTIWTCYILKTEYEKIATMRLHFLASERRRPDQFTVLVRNVPPDPDETVSQLVEHFFLVNHPDHYLTHQISLERDKITSSPKSIMPAAFVSFRTRWGAAVCAQAQQSRNPTIGVTEWAPEPRDVYWDNLAIPYVTLTIRRLVVAVAFFFLTFFFMIPIAFVQSLSNIEGFGSISALERRSASRYYIFQFVNVFLGSIITGTAFQQLDEFIHQSANEIPKTIGVSIPMKATFFITYIMVDGWAGIAGEILRLKPLIIYHLKNFFLVKTEKDREEAMDPGTLGFNTGEPQIQLYFLLGLVYAVVSPILLPFIIVFFALAYVVYRHQIINVYNQEYESAAAFWPDVHGRIITALIVSQLLLMGLLSTKEAAQSTPLLITLPVLTIWFHRFCKGRYEPAFIRHPLQEAMMKDTLERTREPNLNMKGFLQNAYIHPVFKGEDDSENDAPAQEFEKEPAVVLTKRSSRRNTPMPSKYSGSSSSASIPEDDTLKMIP